MTLSDWIANPSLQVQAWSVCASSLTFELDREGLQRRQVGASERDAGCRHSLQHSCPSSWRKQKVFNKGHLSFPHKGHLSFFYSLFIEHLPAVSSYSVYANHLQTTRNIKPWTLLYQKKTFSDKWPSWIKILYQRIFSGLLSIGNNETFMFFCLQCRSHHRLLLFVFFLFQKPTR